MLEEYGSTDEELSDDDDDDADDDDDDDGVELLHESEDAAATSTAALERGEGEEKEEKATNEDHNGGRFTEYTHSQMIMYPFESEDATTASTAATVATVVATAMLEEEVVKDSVNVKPTTTGIAEGEENEKEKKKNVWVSLLLAGFMVLGGWFVVLMILGDCTC